MAKPRRTVAVTGIIGDGQANSLLPGTRTITRPWPPQDCGHLARLRSMSELRRACRPSRISPALTPSGCSSCGRTIWRIYVPATLVTIWPGFYSSSKDPLIELHLRPPRAGILRPCRVYFQPQTMADDESGLHLRDQPREFIAFTEGVRRWIRRWCERREDLLLAPSLVAHFERGEFLREGIQGELKLIG
jgi:hypothetical protein